MENNMFNKKFIKYSEMNKNKSSNSNINGSVVKESNNDSNTNVAVIRDQNINLKANEAVVKESNTNIKDIDKVNYLNIIKKTKENLEYNGILYKHGTVYNCNVLNFRENPNKESSILHTFSAGENILYSETNNPDWFIVKDKDGKVGYCMSEFIKIEI